MCQFTFIELSHLKPEVAVLTLKRPEKGNALNLALMRELGQGLMQLQQQASCRFVEIRGAGKFFCTGLDLKEAANPAFIEPMAEELASLLTALHAMPFVTCAVVQGDALAGGAGIAAACDYVLVAKGSRFAFPEVRRGLVAAQVSTLLLRQMPMRQVRELLLGGDFISSEQAVAMGLANRAVDAAEIDGEAEKIAAKVLQGSPDAIKATKELLRVLEPADFLEDLKKAQQIYQRARQSEEAKEGIASFLEKREPVWSTLASQGH